MIKIQTFICNMFMENCHVVSDETRECLIIDCGALLDSERRAIWQYIGGNGLTPKHLLQTHAHLDHSFGNAFVYETWGLLPELSRLDECLYQLLPEQSLGFLHRELTEEMPAIGRLFSANDTIRFGSHEVKVLATPGHSPGSVLLYIENESVAFSGDTLFAGSIGRTDLEGGSYGTLIGSLKSIAESLPDSTVIYPGHGPKTTIGREKACNPYL